MNDLKNMNDLFRETFDNLEVSPPASVKVAVDKAIVSTKKGLWWLPVLALLLATIAVFLLWDTSSVAPNKTKELAHTKTLKNSNPTDNSTDNTSHYRSDINAADINEVSDNNFEIRNNKLTTDPKPFSKNKTADSKKRKSNQSNRAKENNQKTEKQNKQTHDPGKRDQFATLPNLTEVEPFTVIAEPSGSETSLTEQPKDITENVPADSSETKTAEVKPDSSTTGSNAATTEPDKNHKDKTSKPWTASVYLGPQFDTWKAKEEKSDFNLNPSFRTSLELNRTIANGFSVSSGIGYNKFQEEYSFNEFTGMDTVSVSLDSIPIWQNDSIVGYEYFTYYNFDSTYAKRSSYYTTTAFTIPIYVRKSFDISNDWVVMCDAGLNFNFYKSVKGTNSDPMDPEPATNNFGINATMRLHAGYKLKDWMFTFGVNGSMYLKTPVNYNVTVSKRYYFSPQIGIHYNF